MRRTDRDRIAVRLGKGLEAGDHLLFHDTEMESVSDGVALGAPLDDLFCFTTRATTLADIGDLARSLNWTHILNAGGGLEIGHMGDRSLTCQWTNFDIDDLEASEAADLRSTAIVTGFCISHHRHNPKLIDLLEALLTARGGWVGCDAGGFHPRFTTANIRKLW